jgi:hypothetical protein
MSLRQRDWRRFGGLAGLAALAIVIGIHRGREARAQAPPAAPGTSKADPAVERARQQVRMLDDLYKNAVVSITKTYVAEQEDRPAIMIAKDVFAAMQKHGWHSARLVDATGDPLNDFNTPKTDFEKEASRRIRAGEVYYDRVIGEGQKRRLQAATAVPVVMAKCAECHENRKVGDVLGFLRYEVPIK